MEETGKTEEVAGGPGRKKPGAPKTKWTPEEENALKEGVGRYGAGKWRAIQKDPELAKALSTRSNVDLKDKWRNIQAAQANAEGRPFPKRAKAKKPPPVAEGDAADGKKRIEGDEAGPSGEMRDLPDGYKDLVMSALDSIGDHFMQPPQILELVKSYATDETFHSVKVTSLEKLLTHLAEENVVYRVKRKGYSLVQKHKEPPVDAGLDADDLGNDAKKPRIEDDGLNVNGDIANHHCYPVDDAAKAAAEADSIFVQGEPMGLMGDDDGSARPPKKR